jgi:hypothetical protein
MAARNMQRIEINIQEKIVTQVGYLQGSYQDARSKKRKTQFKVIGIYATNWLYFGFCVKHAYLVVLFICTLTSG